MFFTVLTILIQMMPHLSLAAIEHVTVIASSLVGIGFTIYDHSHSK
ncbi:hypothetical protein GCM10022296_13180 [Secundilactobacillus similis DSM 23365 = JCM 2765]